MSYTRELKLKLVTAICDLDGHRKNRKPLKVDDIAISREDAVANGIRWMTTAEFAPLMDLSVADIRMILRDLMEEWPVYLEGFRHIDEQ